MSVYPGLKLVVFEVPAQLVGTWTSHKMEGCCIETIVASRLKHLHPENTHTIKIEVTGYLDSPNTVSQYLPIHVIALNAIVNEIIGG